MCSYCGCRSITVIGRLTEEHEQIINATGLLSSAVQRGDVAAAHGRARDLARLLHPHTMREEGGLFQELRPDPEFTDHIDSLSDEHDDIDIRLGEIIAGDLDHVTAFIDVLRRHIDREENGIFPAAAIALYGSAWERILARTDPVAETA